MCSSGARQGSLRANCSSSRVGREREAQVARVRDAPRRARTSRDAPRRAGSTRLDAPTGASRRAARRRRLTHDRGASISDPPVRDGECPSLSTHKSQMIYDVNSALYKSFLRNSSSKKGVATARGPVERVRYDSGATDFGSVRARVCACSAASLPACLRAHIFRSINVSRACAQDG